MSYFVTIKRGHYEDNAQTIVRRLEIGSDEIDTLTISDVLEWGMHRERVISILDKVRREKPYLGDRAYLYRWFPQLAPPPPPPVVKPEPFNGDYLWTEVD